MKYNIFNILILSGFPFILVSQSISDSVLLEEIELFESKELKHSIGIRYEIFNKKNQTL